MKIIDGIPCLECLEKIVMFPLGTITEKFDKIGFCKRLHDIIDGTKYYYELQELDKEYCRFNKIGEVGTLKEAEDWVKHNGAHRSRFEQHKECDREGKICSRYCKQSRELKNGNNQ